MISTYPLITSDQFWTGSEASLQRTLQFPSQEAEGIYNAMLILLDSPGHVIEYRSPFSAAPDFPPIWLTEIGKDGPWPVELLSAGASPTSHRRPTCTSVQGTTKNLVLAILRKIACLPGRGATDIAGYGSQTLFNRPEVSSWFSGAFGLSTLPRARSD